MLNPKSVKLLLMKAYQNTTGFFRIKTKRNQRLIWSAIGVLLIVLFNNCSRTGFETFNSDSLVTRVAGTPNPPEGSNPPTPTVSPTPTATPTPVPLPTAQPIPTLVPLPTTQPIPLPQPTLIPVPVPTEVPVTSVASKRAVLVGYGGRRMQTFDGGSTFAQNTTEVNNGGDDNYLIRNVKYANGIFVAVGYRIMTSKDGSTWATPLKSSQWLGGIAYGLNRWVLVGGCGLRYYSKDNGATWIEVANDYIEINGCGHLREVVFGNGIFLAAGDNGITSTSTDGIKWSAATINPMNLRNLVFAKGYFYAIPEGGATKTNVYRSLNAQTWEIVPGLEADNFTALSFSNSTLIFTGSGSIYTSKNGTTWAKVAPKQGLDGPVLSLDGGYVSYGWCWYGSSKDMINWNITKLNDDCPSANTVVE